MKFSRICVCLTILCALTCVLAGCNGAGGSGSRNGLVKAAGTVTYNGEKIAGATIEMRPTDPSITNGLAMGLTDETGAFTLTTDRPNDGAMPGTYKVVVKKTVAMVGNQTREEAEAEMKASGKEDVQIDKSKLHEENQLPAKYADPDGTPLEIEIPAKGNKNIEIVLED